MGRKSQRKGRAGELELVKVLHGYGYDRVRPGQAVSYGAEPDIVGLPGIHCEVKRVEKLNLSNAMNQAIRDSEKFQDGFPAVFHRKNREGWLVTMQLCDWIQLYRSRSGTEKGTIEDFYS